MKSLNALDVIRANPSAKGFEIGEMLFAQFTCPAQEEALGVWSQTDHLVHVVSARSTWKTPIGTLSVNAGETVFFQKGAFVLPPHIEENLCILIFFIPDAFVRQAVRELAPHLPAMSRPPDACEVVMRVNNDVALSTFFRSMLAYFASDEKPPEALLKLKAKELLTGILMSPGNPDLSAYLRSLAIRAAPPLQGIMEANFCHNLPLEAFAKMCHRSLSSFKREFRQCYGTTPAKWLIGRRLVCAAQMVQTTCMCMMDIALECGFEEPAHFSRAFKAKFGRSPTDYRQQTARRDDSAELFAAR